MSEEAVNQPSNTEVVGQTARGSRWRTSWDGCKHIAKAFAATDVKVRMADKVTLGLLLASGVMAVGVVTFPDEAAPIGAGCDLFFALTILFYLAQRLGIVKTFDDRQTVFATELMFGFFIAGIFIIINLTAWCLHPH